MHSSPTQTALSLREIRTPDAARCLERLRAGGHAWWLDSALPGPLGRRSYLGASPWAVARVRGDRLELEVLRDADPRFTVGTHLMQGDPLALLQGLLPPAPAGPPPGIDFCGGAVGYLGYELADRLDAHTSTTCDELGLPDAVWLLVDRVLAIDASGAATACGLGLGGDASAARRRADAAVQALVDALERPAVPPAAPRRAAEVHPDAARIDPAAYTKAVDEIRQEIAAGNVYEANLTARIARSFGGDPWQLYRALRSTNPAPFACFLELPEVAVVGSSPERFLRVERDGRVESRPIKGTARRGRDPLEDAALREALLHSEKDRAENLMIVDLVRNDLGRVCETGSVHAPELMAVEAYASVFQLVSTVRGKLAGGRDALDAVRAAFPPGSMTGAPKLAAMALLDRLEPVRRGIYSGAVGYWDVYGGCDLSVVIRTALVAEGRAWLHAGGAVVADSEPEAEYREALEKLRPLLRALEACEGSDPPAAISSHAPRHPAPRHPAPRHRKES